MAIRFNDPEAPKGEFLTFTDEDGAYSAMYRLSTERAEQAVRYRRIAKVEDALMELLEVERPTDRFTIKPHATLPGRGDFLRPKYRQIHKITLDGFGIADVFEQDGPEVALECLPAGFVRDPEFGLGLLKEIRFIIDAIEKIADVDTLLVSTRLGSGRSGNTFTLSSAHFEAVRRGIGRVHTQALASARLDKTILAHNSLLTEIMPEAFPLAARPYRPDTIFKTIAAPGAAERLSPGDQIAAVQVVSAAKRDLARNEPSALMELQRELELVTLEALVERMSVMVGKPLDEADWQAFFIEHPFVLSLAFNLPIAAIGERVSVGGRTFSVCFGLQK